MDNNIFDEYYGGKIGSRNQEFYSLESQTQSTSLDSSAKEKMMMLHLEQSFLLSNLDFFVLDRSHVNKTYDSLVLHKKTNHLFRVQVKSSSSIDYDGPKHKGKWKNKPKENVFIFRNFGIDEAMNHYKEISVFVLYCGKVYETPFGPEYRYKIYLIAREELIGFLNKSNSKKMLKIDMTDPYWISKNGDFKLFDRWHNAIESTTTKAIDVFIVDKDNKVVDNKVIYEYTFYQMTEAEEACRSINKKFDYGKFVEFMEKSQNG